MAKARLKDFGRIPEGLYATAANLQLRGAENIARALLGGAQSIAGGMQQAKNRKQQDEQFQQEQGRLSSQFAASQAAAQGRFDAQQKRLDANDKKDDEYRRESLELRKQEFTARKEANEWAATVEKMTMARNELQGLQFAQMAGLPPPPTPFLDQNPGYAQMAQAPGAHREITSAAKDAVPSLDEINARMAILKMQGGNPIAAAEMARLERMKNVHVEDEKNKASMGIVRSAKSAAMNAGISEERAAQIQKNLLEAHEAGNNISQSDLNTQIDNVSKGQAVATQRAQAVVEARRKDRAKERAAEEKVTETRVQEIAKQLNKGVEVKNKEGKEVKVDHTEMALEKAVTGEDLDDLQMARKLMPPGEARDKVDARIDKLITAERMIAEFYAAYKEEPTEEEMKTIRKKAGL